VDYLDFRALLRDLVAQRSGDPAYSFRALSRRAGLRSTNYLSLVIKGERTLSEATAQRLAAALALGRRDTDYFCVLVATARAKSATQREELRERLSRLRDRGEVRVLGKAQSDYHSRWYIPAVRELVARPDFDPNPHWIARTLQPAITPAQARRALRVLEALGLIGLDASGHWVQSDPLLSTGEGPLGHHVFSFHRAMLDRASQALDDVPRQDREVSALTMGVSEAVFRELQERIARFRRELLHLAELPQDVDRVVQINFQLFPLSRRRESEP